MNNNIIKNNMKTIIIVSLIIFLGLLITVVTYTFGYYFQDNLKFEREYEKLNKKDTLDGKKYPYVDISSDNVVKYSDYKEIIDKINNKDDFVVYLGSASCLYCRSVVQVLFDASEFTNIDKIYYVDIEKETDYFAGLVSLLDNKFIKDGKFNAPLVLFFVDGNVVSYKAGTFTSHKDPYVKLNDTQLTTLTDIYMSGINDVIAGMQN